MKNLRFELLAVGVVGFCGLAWGRGEGWVARPPAPPPVETLTNADRYIEWKFREDVTDPKTGLNTRELTEAVDALVAACKTNDAWCVVKAKAYALLCDRMAIDVSPLDWYPSIALWNRYDLPLKRVVGRRNGEIGRKYYPEVLKSVADGNRAGIWTTWKDFDHSVPVWEDCLVQGFTGMRDRVRRCSNGTAFYQALEITADASIRLIERFAAQAKLRNAKPKTIAALEQLAKGSPRTAYEAMLFIDLYFFMCEHLDAMQCRSLSIIDRTLTPYYRADLAAGRTTEAEFREQFKHFLWQWGSIDNYWGQPITMGGTKPDGSTEYNEVSMIILDVMDECALPTPKFHIKIARNTPVSVLNKLLDMARRHRSLTFIGEESVRRVLEHYGYKPEETQHFYTKGCYEFCVPNGANSTGTGYVNLLKQVELAMKDAAEGRFDPPTYEAFEEAVIARMTNVCHRSLANCSVFERHLDDVNPANVGSLGVAHAVEVGKDAFANGAARGNNTGLQISALGTTADAFVAVKELVYEKRELTLAKLGAILAANWKDHEALRLRMKRSHRKWGNNDPDANEAARRISHALAAEVDGKPNSRGGFYGLVGHTARAYIYQGEVTGATPDGRKAGEEFSKNLSATMGADVEGATALVNSLVSLDSREWPGDFPLDMMLHPSTVAGDRGLELMRSLIQIYFARGGLQIQFVVVSPEELRDAQKHPEKYENLQIRVCGWNVRWNDMPKSEQDAYILRAESIMR